MQISKSMLEEEIRVLQKAAKLHAKYSISQYKQVLTTLEALEKEKDLLEEKVKIRTSHLEKEIAQKETLASKLEKIAKYDQLTGLANRYLFLSELELLVKEARLLNKTFSLLFIDLDGFKLINDTYGHEVGDALLQIVAQRIRKHIRSDDIVARLGGDEFTVVLRNLNDIDKIKELTTLLIQEIQKIIQIDDFKIYVGASVGIYIYDTKQNDTYQNIIAKADIAMYESKKTGKGIYTFFDESMQEELQKLTSIKQKIKNALKDGEFVNHFQPIVSSLTHEIRGAEVLLRWYNDGKLETPKNFIPILEDDIHLIRDVTFWQIEEVLKMMPKSKLFYSINLSAKLLNYELVAMLEKLIQEYDFDTSKIHFEVTETSLSTNIIQASKILAHIKSLGFYLSLDDFGTGYSSLAYLRELSFDTLKIDKKFIDDTKKSKKNRRLLLAMITMAQTLKMKIVLEGIEEESQLSFFKKDKHIKLQGYYFYRPMTKDRYLETISFSPKAK